MNEFKMSLSKKEQGERISGRIYGHIKSSFNKLDSFRNWKLMIHFEDNLHEMMTLHLQPIHSFDIKFGLFQKKSYVC